MDICSTCGAPVYPPPDEVSQEEEGIPLRWVYILSFLLPPLGAVLGFLLLFDKKTACHGISAIGCSIFSWYALRFILTALITV